MKRPKFITEKIQKQTMKMTVNKIIDILYRMYDAHEDKDTSFEDFCKTIQSDSVEQFYARPISKIKSHDNVEG